MIDPITVTAGVIGALQVARIVAEEAPEVYAAITHAIQHGQAVQINWEAALIPVLLDEAAIATPVDWAAVLIMARTIYGEARNQEWLGLVAVGHVILNRVQRGGWWGRDIVAVCHCPKQFSCWNASDPSRPKLLKAHPAKDAAFRQCLAAAVAVMSGLEPDNTFGSCHYHTKSISPKWAKGKRSVVTIGDHVFYNDIA